MKARMTDLGNATLKLPAKAEPPDDLRTDLLKIAARSYPPLRLVRPEVPQGR